MSIWSQQSHKCWEGYYTNPQCNFKKIGVNGKVIPLGTSHKVTQDSRDKWDGSIKRGCGGEFTIKTLYLFKHILKLYFIQWNHANQDGLHVHEDLKMGERFAFATHLSQEIKDFVMEQLRLGLMVSQLMAKHRGDVKK